MNKHSVQAGVSERLAVGSERFTRLRRPALGQVVFDDGHLENCQSCAVCYSISRDLLRLNNRRASRQILAQ